MERLPKVSLNPFDANAPPSRNIGTSSAMASDAPSTTLENEASIFPVNVFEAEKVATPLFLSENPSERLPPSETTPLKTRWLPVDTQLFVSRGAPIPSAILPVKVRFPRKVPSWISEAAAVPRVRSASNRS